VARSIRITEEGAEFCLQGQEERCPLLNENGLCDLILQAGEASLCQICRDHPRFRNEFSDRTEMGLGLCCEAAAKLILTKSTKTGLLTLKDDGCPERLPPAEEEFFILRRQLIELVQNRRSPMSSRMHKLCNRFRLPFRPDTPFEDHARFLLTLERLEEGWADRLRPLTEFRSHKAAPGQSSWTGAAFEQLAVYLLFRHLAEAADGISLPRQLTWCVFAWTLVRRLCASLEEGGSPLRQEDMLEICRQYSSELEYSDENKDAILDYLLGEAPARH